MRPIAHEEDGRIPGRLHMGEVVMERRRLLVVAAALIAALGAVMVLVYVRGADHRAQQHYETKQVLTANQEISAGETYEQAVKSGKLGYKTVVADDVVPDSVGPDGASSLAGKAALATIYPGEQVVSAEFGDQSLAAATTDLPIPPKKVAISVTLTDPARVAGYVEPGSQVAVFLNGTDAGGTPFTRLLLPKVTVLGVGSTPVAGSTTTTDTDGGGDAPAETLPNTLITLAVSQKEAQKVLFAQQNGALAFGLLSRGSHIGAAPQTDLGNLFE
ncbi:Flp pilus assembly protein CpaB [Nocardioides sp. KR10-350]|uniref:Flp pilus assembly protein CpaB n=1 Tax=Nocardioides cheoyonin TaxID=3156615 RepID=UPI0032B43252